MQKIAPTVNLAQKHAAPVAHPFYRPDLTDVSFIKLEMQWLQNHPEDGLRLAFAGQAKAGKSTLLNAILNNELLASSALQCSSEIVSIAYGECYESCIQFADDKPARTELYESAKQLAEAMQAYTSIPDRFRNIPHTLLDHDILAGEVNADAKGYIQNLERRSNLKLKNEISAIKSYLASRRKADIPLSIHIKAPSVLHRQITFLDSPGFNAAGGMQEKNTGLFAQADVVMLVHSLTSPIEHAELHRLVQCTSESHRPQDIFLVLTQSFRVPLLEKQSKLDDARRIYGSLVLSENIIAVDSLAYLTLNELHNANNEKELEKFYKKTINELESVGVKSYKVDTVRNKLSILREFNKTDSKYDIKKHLFDISGMSTLFDALEKINETNKIKNNIKIALEISLKTKVLCKNSMQELAESEITNNNRFEEIKKHIDDNNKKNNLSTISTLKTMDSLRSSTINNITELEKRNNKRLIAISRYTTKHIAKNKNEIEIYIFNTKRNLSVTIFIVAVFIFSIISCAIILLSQKIMKLSGVACTDSISCILQWLIN